MLGGAGVLQANDWQISFWLGWSKSNVIKWFVLHMVFQKNDYQNLKNHIIVI